MGITAKLLLLGDPLVGVGPERVLRGRPVMGHNPATTGLGRLLIKPPKLCQGRRRRRNRWTIPHKCTPRGKAVPESHRLRRRYRSCQPARPAVINTYRQSPLVHVTSGKDRQHQTPLTVRVIDYRLSDGRENPEQYRSPTTILDPKEATTEDHALAYTQRW